MSVSVYNHLNIVLSADSVRMMLHSYHIHNRVMFYCELIINGDMGSIVIFGLVYLEKIRFWHCIILK